MGFIARLGRLWLVIVFVVACVYVALTNKDRVDVRLPPFIEAINLPVYMIIGSAFVMGALTAAAFFGLEHVRRGLKIRRLEKRLAALAPPLDSSPTYSSAATAVTPLQQEPRL